MKKLSYRARCYRIRKSIKVIELRTLQKLKARPFVRRCGVLRSTASARTCIQAPEKFAVLIPESRVSLFAFFEAVEKALSRGLRVKLDFGKVKELHSCGTLVFMARLDIWIGRYPRQLSCNYPADDVVEQLFQHVAILSRLGLSSRKKISHDRVSLWHFYSRSSADPSGFKSLTQSVIEQIDHANSALFADCLNEAICNTVGHAYKFFAESRLALVYRKWWIFSQYKDERLFVVIYDVGEGIPTSLRRKPELSEYFRIRQYASDAVVIQSAIESNRTSTKQPERGKGLPEMLEFSKLLHGGKLSISSGKGECICNYDANGVVLRRRKFNRGLPGTLVQWTIPFRKGHDNEEHNDLDS